MKKMYVREIPPAETSLIPYKFKMERKPSPTDYMRLFVLAFIVAIIVAFLCILQG